MSAFPAAQTVPVKIQGFICGCDAGVRTSSGSLRLATLSFGKERVKRRNLPAKYPHLLLSEGEGGEPKRAG